MGARQASYPSSQAWPGLAGSEACLAGSEACLAGSQACLAGSWALEGGTDGWTDERTNGRTENLPILQDFVPYRGRCPKTEFRFETEPFCRSLIGTKVYQEGHISDF